MAKTIARIVFGDPDACLRFDMSEFKGEHSGDRLIGAPPGYVGFDQGGELTNAMRENPFRVLLFDEIEKAHPRILDKFLQVLEDGRLTDGRGETVYFSESLIIFKSNVGIVRRDERTGIVERLVSREDQEQNPEAYEQKILDGVKNHFHLELQRPELHNRLGENVVVFNYITDEVAKAILDGMIANVANTCLEDTSLTLKLTDEAREQLTRSCTGEDVLENGGRGIGSKLEAVLVNPLARHIFDENLREGRFPWQHLSRRHGDILRHLDAVIAEPYVERLAPQWLRGSGNQTIHLLSDLGRRRYADASGQTNGLQVVAAGDDIRIIGIPNRGDLERMQEKLAGLGVAFGERSW